MIVISETQKEIGELLWTPCEGFEVCKGMIRWQSQKAASFQGRMCMFVKLDSYSHTQHTTCMSRVTAITKG